MMSIDARVKDEKPTAIGVSALIENAVMVVDKNIDACVPPF